MRIAVIGTGNIGGTLGRRWLEAGYEVRYGSRSQTGKGPGGGQVTAISEAVDGAEVVVLAVPGPAVADVIVEHGPALAGATVIDAANRIGAAEFNSRAAISGAVPDVRYVRAFNTLGWENFAEPPAGANLFFAADPRAREVTEELIRVVGLEPAYVGDADTAGTVDALLPLWFALVRQQGGDRKLAWRMVR